VTIEIGSLRRMDSAFRFPELKTSKGMISTMRCRRVGQRRWRRRRPIRTRYTFFGPLTETIAAVQAHFIVTGEPSDELELSIAGGDLDGDGVGVLIIGALSSPMEIRVTPPSFSAFKKMRLSSRLPRAIP
jgi:hypothetical protein